MELKTARLTLLIDPNKKTAFEHLCAQQDLTPSQVVRQLIRDYLIQHGAAYVPSGEQAALPAASPTAPRKAGAAKAGRTTAGSQAATTSRKRASRP
jgi:hypothetical protein